MGNESSQSSIIDDTLSPISVIRSNKYVRISSDEDTIQKLVNYYNGSKSSLGLKVIGNNVHSVYFGNVEHVIPNDKIDSNNYFTYYTFYEDFDDYADMKIFFCGEWRYIDMKFIVSYGSNSIILHPQT